MSGLSTQATEPKRLRYHNLKHFAKHLFSNMILGLFVLFLLTLFHGTIIVQHLEQAGSDFVATLCAKSPNCATHKGLQVVAIELAPATLVGDDKQRQLATTKELRRVVEVVRRSAPSAVLLDVNVDLGASQRDMDALRMELDNPVGNAPVVMLHRVSQEHPGDPRVQDNFVLLPNWFKDQREHIKWAVAALPVGPDGIIRSLLEDVCVLPPDAGWKPVPTLAFGLQQDRRDHSQCPDKGERDKKNPERYIVYAADAGVMDRHATGGPIDFMRSGEIGCLTTSQIPCAPDETTKERLAGKFVIIGQISWQDTHMTPIGPMPGLLIQANALFTALNYPTGVERGEDRLMQALEIFVFALMMALVPPLRALVVSVVCFPFRWLSNSKPVRCRSIAWRIPDNPEDQPMSLAELVSRLIDMLIQTIVVALLIFTFYMFWVLILLIPIATNALGAGIVAGTFLPILATGLEALIETGETYVRVAHAAVDLISTKFASLGRKNVPTASGAILVLVCLTTSTALADNTDCPQTGPWLKITFGRADDVFLLDDSPLVKHPERLTCVQLHPFDTVQIRASRAKAEIVYPSRNEAEKLEGPNVHSLVLPPSPPDSDIGVLSRFFAAMIPAEHTTRLGSTVISRGGLLDLGDKPDAPPPNPITQIKQTTAGSDVTVPLSGALRPLPALAAQDQMLVASRTGLAMAWLGGKPPYTATIESNSTPQTLQLYRPLLWLPDWRIPGPDATLVIKDSVGDSLRTHLTAATRPEPADVSPSEAVALFQTGGDAWRLEAFRDLQEKAGTDTLAAQAVAAIRLSGAE